LWKQILLKELDTPKLPYACVRESFLTTPTS
jgi:hypothetical protein